MASTPSSTGRPAQTQGASVWHSPSSASWTGEVLPRCEVSAMYCCSMHSIVHSVDSGWVGYRSGAVTDAPFRQALSVRRVPQGLASLRALLVPHAAGMSASLAQCIRQRKMQATARLAQRQANRTA